jgi:hypothetical protein
MHYIYTKGLVAYVTMNTNQEWEIMHKAKQEFTNPHVQFRGISQMSYTTAALSNFMERTVVY